MYESDSTWDVTDDGAVTDKKADGEMPSEMAGIKKVQRQEGKSEKVGMKSSEREWRRKKENEGWK